MRCTYPHVGHVPADISMHSIIRVPKIFAKKKKEKVCTVRCLSLQYKLYKKNVTFERGKKKKLKLVDIVFFSSSFGLILYTPHSCVVIYNDERWMRVDVCVQ